MKTLTTLTAIAALVAGISIASAASPMQEKNPTAKGGAATQSQNATMSKSGAMGSKMGGKKVIGKSSVCARKGGELKCTYTTMAKCHSANRANGWICVQNPSSTTGAK